MFSHDLPAIVPGVSSSNHWRYDQGFVAVICTTMAAKSHSNARSRHAFETNEHCFSDGVSSRSWPIISLVIFGTTRRATVATNGNFKTIQRDEEEERTASMATNCGDFMSVHDWMTRKLIEKRVCLCTQSKRKLVFSPLVNRN